MRGIADLDNFAPAAAMGTDEGPGLILHALVDFAEKPRLGNRLFIPGFLNPLLAFLARRIVDRFDLVAPRFRSPGGAVIRSGALTYLLQQLRQRHGRIRGDGNM